MKVCEGTREQKDQTKALSITGLLLNETKQKVSTQKKVFGLFLAILFRQIQ